MRATLLIIPDRPARIWNWDTYSSADLVCLKFRSPAWAFPVMSEGEKASLRAVVNAAAVPRLYPPSFLVFSVRNDSFQVQAAPLVRNDKMKTIFLSSVSWICEYMMKYKSTFCRDEDTLFLSPVNSFGRLILVYFAAMLSSSWGLVFGVSTFKICTGDIGNSCFCGWDDDASASAAGSSGSGSGSWNDSSVPVSSDSVLVSSSSEEDSGAYQWFIVVLSGWYSQGWFPSCMSVSSLSLGVLFFCVFLVSD